MPKKPPNLFEYADYRRFIEDMIVFRKQNDGKYSYRYYSRRAGFSSTNFLGLVVKGQRNLSNSSIGKLSKGLGLNKEERTFFENLVHMNQADSIEEKDLYYQRMLKSKPFLKLKRLDRSCYDYFSNWYNPVIREMVDYLPQPVEHRLIARLLSPPVSVGRVNKAIKLLLSLGLIEEYEKGKYSKADPVLTTGDEVRSLQIANFHKQMAKLAVAAIDRLSAEQRDVSGIVMSVNQQKLPEIKQRIAAFRNDMAELAGRDSDENQVIFIQICAFPLTEPLED